MKTVQKKKGDDKQDEIVFKEHLVFIPMPIASTPISGPVVDQHPVATSNDEPIEDVDPVGTPRRSFATSRRRGSLRRSITMPRLTRKMQKPCLKSALVKEPLPRWSSTPRHGLLCLGIGVSSRTEMANFWPYSAELFQPKHTLFETKP